MIIYLHRKTKNNFTMKYLKLMVIAMLVAFTFGTGKAEAQQVVVRAGVSVGPYYHNGHHYHHRRAYWRNHHRYYRYY
jgi:hypothetical protein